MLRYREERVFTDRKDAGVQLGNLLAENYKNKNALVLGIPRGGVEVAYYVADILNAELSTIISKKLPYPGQEEFAFGAVTEDGSYFLSSAARRLDEGTISSIITNQLKEIERRVEKYRSGQPIPEMKNRTVILVDDGIATGSTLVPALKFCKARQAAKIIVAAPVSGNSYVPEIDDLADEVIVSEQPENFFAVGQIYEDFHGLNDSEVITLLERYNRKS